MTEITIHGRGGQGGVTLAKLIATAHFLKGQHAQAFGVYAAERSGAPLQAYVRIDEREITNHNQVRAPDHVIVLDRTLIAPGVLAGLKVDGNVLLNTPQVPAELGPEFAGRRVGTVDATAIAVAQELGTRAVPIVNTTMFGAAGCMLGLTWEELAAALDELKFSERNSAAARAAFESVRFELASGAVRAVAAPARPAVAGFFDPRVGDPPAIRTGAWANRRPQRHELTPPCENACPAGNDVRAFVAEVARRQYDRALELLMQTSPFPGVCGRVCPAPCKDACNRAEFDQAIEVRELERYAAEHGRRPPVVRPWRRQAVAVVGSGPAGLSATYHLARLGYPVTLYEAGDTIGGLLRTGIPAYRLPADVLDDEISYILRHGVRVETGLRIGRAALVELTHAFGAVFVATGLQEQRALNLGGLASEYVMQGIDFLDQARRHDLSVRGERVIVVGGGNTAVDAARVALRMGARSVRIVYRRTRAEMPAIREEIEEALEEGVALDELVAPLNLARGPSGAVLTCTRMRLGAPDASGRPQPVVDASEGAQFDLTCDRVLLALGQTPDLTILPEGAAVHEDERMIGLTGAPVFTGGDLATNDGTVAAAIGSGRRAALHIHRTLTGEDLFEPPAGPIAGPEVIHTHVFTHAAAPETGRLAPAYRRRNFAEVRTGLFPDADHDVAVEEAGRCFSCGVCNMCDRCLKYCPEGILRRNGDGYRFDYEYCKGCGVCAAECPRGVVFMAEL